MTIERQRILFVDDEPMILSALRNLLHKDRDRWEIVVAEGGERGLAEMRARPFDVVVSDMRMPGMDGAAFLQHVKSEFPATARIMLSGHAERAAIVRALPAVHQLLSKPCERGVLRSALERCLRPELDPRIRVAICQLDKLPSPREICRELADTIGTTGVSAADVLAIIERDPGLASKVLQLVNSTYFGAGEPSHTLELAVARLGTDHIRYILLTTSLFSSFEDDLCPGVVLSDLQRNSVAIANNVRRLVSGADQDEAFAVALLHHVGHVVLAIGMPDEYRRAHSGESELAVYGTTHAEIGATLLGVWGLPARIVDAIRFHHDPGSAPPQSRRIAAAVHLASALAEPSELDAASVERAECPDLVSAWRVLTT